MTKDFKKEKKEDSVMGNAYDAKLMKRLLSYAKPYWHYLLLAIVLMVIVTALELVRPYLLKVAIDDHISGYEDPMYQLEIDSPYEGVIYKGKKYSRIKSFNEEENRTLSSYPIHDIVKKDKNYTAKRTMVKIINIVFLIIILLSFIRIFCDATQGCNTV